MRASLVPVSNGMLNPDLRHVWWWLGYLTSCYDYEEPPEEPQEPVEPDDDE